MAEQARVTWTEERLDDLSRRLDQGFGRMDAELRSLGGRIDARSERIDALGEQLNERVDAQSARIDSLQHALLAQTVTILLGFAGLIVTQL